jgi:hypothetical protein
MVYPGKTESGNIRDSIILFFAALVVFLSVLVMAPFVIIIFIYVVVENLRKE